MADTLHPCCFKSRMFIKSSRLSIGLLGQAQRISPLGIFRPALLGNFQPAEVGNFQSAFLGNSRPALTPRLPKPVFVARWIRVQKQRRSVRKVRAHKAMDSKMKHAELSERLLFQGAFR